MTKHLLTVLFCLAFAHFIAAQDIHSSLNPLSPQLNPALTGLLRGEYTRRLQASHRNQWASVMRDGAYSTTQGSYEQAIFVGYDDFVGLSVSGFYDQAGKMPLRQSQMNLTGSYIKNLGNFGRGKSIFVSAGGQLGMAWRRFDFSKISWSEQFNGAGYNLSLPTGEAASLNNFPNRLYGDVGAGFAFTYTDNNENHWRRGKLVWLNGGFSLLHLGGVLKTSVSNISAFKDSVSLLERRLSAHASAMLGLNSDIYLIPTAFFSKQANAFQLNTGLYTNIRWGGKNRQSAANALQMGVLMRFNRSTEEIGMGMDALIPTLRFDFGAMSMGVSYDINMSILRQASGGHGGFEFNFAYLWYRSNPDGANGAGNGHGKRKGNARGRSAVRCANFL
jgi:type IX secretion system PorP/SprF family membrane protein